LIILKSEFTPPTFTQAQIKVQNGINAVRQIHCPENTQPEIPATLCNGDFGFNLSKAASITAHTLP
jgi:hypothetical protein